MFRKKRASSGVRNSSAEGRRRSRSSSVKSAGHPNLIMPEYKIKKDIEFAADAPGRVIVRLERLMGSDKIRIMDSKYMNTLLERLREEEEMTWQHKTFVRRKAENNRFRQLAIDGYMEPGPDMQDLYQHPVFRVNRILSRLSKLDNRFTPIYTLPPIIPIEPFLHDDSGKIFKTYPTHVVLSELVKSNQVPSTINLHLLQSGSGQHLSIRVMDQSSMQLGSPGSATWLTNEDFGASEGMEEEQGEEEVKSRVNSFMSIQESIVADDEEGGIESVESPRKVTLSEIQRKYGIAPNADLSVSWKPYRSGLLDPMFVDENKGVWDLYELGSTISNVFEREQSVADEYMNAIRKGKQEGFFLKRDKVGKGLWDVQDEMYDTSDEYDFDKKEDTGVEEPEPIQPPRNLYVRRSQWLDGSQGRLAFVLPPVHEVSEEEEHTDE